MSEELENQEENNLLSFDDIDNTPNLEDVQDPLLRKELEERQNKELKDYSAHRRIFPNSFNGSKLVWDTPFMQKPQDVQFPEFPNLTKNSVSAGNIIGLVGIITKARFGFTYWKEDDEEDTKKSNVPTCKTIAAYSRIGEEDQLIVNDNPLPKPIRQPHQSKSKYNEYTKDLKRMKSNFTIYGSRPPLDEEGNEIEVNHDPSEPITMDNIDQRFRTCESCVYHGQHFDGEVNSKGEMGRKADKCGMSGQIKFCVFAVVVLEEDVNGESSVVYYKPEDYGIDTLQGPFMAQSTVNKTMGLSELGKKDFDLQINKTTNPIANQENGFVAFPTYLDWLKDNPNRHKYIEGNVIYNALTLITPVEVQKEDPKSGGASYIPVFKLMEGKYITNSLIRKDVPSLAYEIEQAEIKAANGKETVIPSHNPIFDALKQEGYKVFDSEKEEVVGGEEPVEVKQESEESPKEEKAQLSPSFPFKRSKAGSQS